MFEAPDDPTAITETPDKGPINPTRGQLRPETMAEGFNGIEIETKVLSFVSVFSNWLKNLVVSFMTLKMGAWKRGIYEG